LKSPTTSVNKRALIQIDIPAYHCDPADEDLETAYVLRKVYPQTENKKEMDDRIDVLSQINNREFVDKLTREKQLQSETN
jgi:hypothetical protein